MDNVIYIVLAAAVFIAMAGILLFIGSDTLQQTGSDADDIRDSDRPGDWTGNFFENRLQLNKFEFSSNSLDRSKEAVISG